MFANAPFRWTDPASSPGMIWLWLAIMLTGWSIPVLAQDKKSSSLAYC
jgi:hypothetical protein